MDSRGPPAQSVPVLWDGFGVPVGIRAVEGEVGFEDGPVGITRFSYEGLDGLRERLLEVLESPEGRIDVVIEEWLRGQEPAICAEVCNRLLGYIITARKPRLAAYQLCFAAGLDLTLGLDMAKVARRCSVTKQAMQQGVDRFAKELGLRKTRSMREEESRETMRQRNFRQTKHV